MSIWHPSMYGVGTGFDYDAGDPVVPLDPGVQDMDEWWFRGPQARALKPQNGSVMELPAGGTAAVEIACNVAWTSYGSRTTNPSDLLSACPDNYGAYHTGDPTGPLDDDLLSGCALAVAYKSDIDEVGWDDLVVFSTNQTCVRQKVTTFDLHNVLHENTAASIEIDALVAATRVLGAAQFVDLAKPPTSFQILLTS
ncbi:galactose-binding domain-like protein [Rhodotorula toruloides]|uniref:Galactose-binding domain-like protein n=1 Tax=Rhodotorula toruloides TaxID=5286 RepID=A0A511KME5_RHOTO|nr:galactose-binding domain-like protein [Rhodotorula toruloides]